MLHVFPVLIILFIASVQVDPHVLLIRPRINHFPEIKIHGQTVVVCIVKMHVPIHLHPFFCHTRYLCQQT